MCLDTDLNEDTVVGSWNLSWMRIQWRVPLKLTWMRILSRVSLTDLDEDTEQGVPD